MAIKFKGFRCYPCPFVLVTVQQAANLLGFFGFFVVVFFANVRLAAICMEIARKWRFSVFIIVCIMSININKM